MSWATLIIQGIKILAAVLSYLNERKLIKEGEDKAIAAMALELLERTESGKALREHVKGLTIAEEEDLWNRMVKR